MSEDNGFQARGRAADLGQRSIVRERLLEAAIDDIFDVLADQPFLSKEDQLDPVLVASAKRTAVRVMSDPTPEETAEFWSVYATLILAVERPQPAVASVARPVTMPRRLGQFREAFGRLSGWTPALSGQLVGGTIVAIAATVVIYSVFQSRPVSMPAAGARELAVGEGRLRVPGTMIANPALPIVGVLAAEIDPGFLVIYDADHEGRLIPGLEMADEAFVPGEFFEPPDMEPVLLLPNVEPDPIPSVPFVHRSADESVSFGGDYLLDRIRPGA